VKKSEEGKDYLQQHEDDDDDDEDLESN